MIDATFRFEPAPEVLVIDLWDGELPAVSARVLQVEPRRWWLFGAAAEVAQAVAGRGAIAPIGGGLMRAVIDGPGWRELLTISGLFDVESPTFTTGDVASTVIHHVPVRIVATGDRSCEVYCAASYAPTLRELWQDVCKGG